MEDFGREMDQAMGVPDGRSEGDVVLAGSKSASVAASQSFSSVGLGVAFYFTNGPLR